MTGRPIKVGGTVRLSFGFADRSGEGDYEVIRAMPARESGERHYRVGASMAAKGDPSKPAQRFKIKG